jgi:hypothetical protein
VVGAVVPVTANMVAGQSGHNGYRGKLPEKEWRKGQADLGLGNGVFGEGGSGFGMGGSGYGWGCGSE